MVTHRMLGLALTALLALSAPVAAELNLNPRRVVFEDGDRSATLTLLNRGTEAETYRLYWVFRRMDATLGLQAAESAEDVGTPSSSDFLRYSPRQITLNAGQTQTVRLLLRRPPDLAEGEYRAHLMFEREADTITAGSQNSDNLSISINVAYGLTVPIIVRSGELDRDIRLTSAALVRDEDQTFLRVGVSRFGERSVFGRLRVTHVQGGRETLLAHVPNVAVYSETTEGEKFVELDTNANQLESGEIRVEMFDREEAGEPLLSVITLQAND